MPINGAQRLYLCLLRQRRLGLTSTPFVESECSRTILHRTRKSDKLEIPSPIGQASLDTRLPPLLSAPTQSPRKHRRQLVTTYNEHAFSQ